MFADIGLPEPEERLAKADLAIRIAEAIRMQRLTQNRAAHILQRLINRRFRVFCAADFLFSTERLMRFLTLLGPRR